jgi:hypothetical protein
MLRYTHIACVVVCKETTAIIMLNIIRRHREKFNEQVSWFVQPCSSGMGRGSSVGTVTRYGLDGPEIQSLWGRDFPHLPDRPWVAPSLISGGKGGRGVALTTHLHLAPRLKKE